MTTARSSKEPTLSTLKILRALLDDADGDHFGLDLIRRTSIGPGTLYPTLAQLEADRWIVGMWERIDPAVAGRRRRRYYRLTPAGRSQAVTALQEMADALTPPRREDGRVARRGLASS